jgi:hypothetical protein
MHMEGGLRKRGNTSIKVCHIAELLAGETP